VGQKQSCIKKSGLEKKWNAKSGHKKWAKNGAKKLNKK